MSREEEEEKYIKRKEAELKEEARRERQLDAIRQKERKKVKAQLKTNEEVADESLELGFDSTTARVLPLVPLIQVAWADGTVTSRESNSVLTLAGKFGIEPGTAAYDFLQLLLDEQPSDLFFERVNRVIAHLIESNPDEWSGRNLTDLSREVAEASGGFYVFDPISEEEQEVLDDIAEAFEVDSKSASDLTSEDE